MNGEQHMPDWVKSFVSYIKPKRKKAFLFEMI